MAVEGPTASERGNAMEDQLFVGLHEGLLGAVFSPEALRRVDKNSLRGNAVHGTSSPKTAIAGQAPAA